MTYIYYCERCGSMIEVEVEVDETAHPPAEVACPKCGFLHAVKAFAAPQQSDCCGPVSEGSRSG